MSQWLERLAAQAREATPSPAPSRTYSPAPPRKSIQLSSNSIPRRPGYPSRSSSLTVASLANSTDSLPSAAKVPNGAHLKNQLSGSTVAEIQDPLDVLQSILGPVKSIEKTNGEREAGTIPRPETLEEDIEFGELSLEDFASAPIGSKSHSLTNGLTEKAVVQDFEKEKDKFEELHKSIAACDEVLKSVETYLTSFRADLAAVSNEIETLQNRSTTLHNRLENRKAVEKVLGPELEAFSIPPSVVRKITEGAVDEQWLKALQELEKRSKLIEARIKDGKDVKAVQDIQPFINDVSTRAVERIRDYVVAQIRALRSPSINAQVIQQNSFLRYKEVFAFLARQQPTLANEISQAYNNTMRWYYSHNFMRYKTALEKLNLHVIDQSDTIADTGAKRSGKAGAPHDAFSIGRRLEILRSNDVALPSFAAEDDKGTHYLEVPFRTFNLALVDNVSAEYSFLTEFFARQPYQTTNKRFNEILQPTFEHGQALTKQLIENSLDAVGVLICVRLTQQMAFELQRRKVPAAEGYINATNMLLWPRFQKILDSHCESVRKATAALPGKPAGSALTLTSSAPQQSTAPHALTQRYANFVQALLALSSEAGDDEPTATSLGRLRGEYVAFLLKMSKGIADARKRDRFLHNNYSLVCTIIGDTEGKLAEELKEHFVDLRDSINVVQ